MRIATLLTVLLLLLPPAAAALPADMDPVRRAVVRISVVRQHPDYAQPWNPGEVSGSAGTGFLIEGRRLLTNAHVTSDARLIVVEKEDDPRRFEARVRFVAHDCDLALLEVLDPDFYEGMTPLDLGRVPALDSTVAVIGYPIGGRRLSVTRGVVSRIDFQTYSHSGVDGHLAIQIDAPINAGNSGGPVMQAGAAVGVAFQVFAGRAAQNVGYMIPVPVIRRFLEDVADGRYDHYVDLGVYQFPLVNPTMRRAVGLGPGDQGVLVSGVIQASAAWGVLEAGDVLLTIDGRPIFADGQVLMDGERMLLNEVVERKFEGDTVRLGILRRHERLTLDVPLNRPWPYLMQARSYDVRPRYLIFAGILFQPLSHDFMRGGRVRDVDLLYHYTQFLTRSLYLERPEVVVIGRILPDAANTYLEAYRHGIVDTVNGRRIGTLEDLAAALALPVADHEIRLLHNGRPLIVPAAAAAEAQARILEAYGIREAAYLDNGIVPERLRRPEVAP